MEASETSIGAGLVAPVEAGTPTVSIVIPAFNEAGRIAATIRKIEAFVRRSPYLTEIIVVDDGSRDHTVRQGVLAASGKYVLFTDADLSAPIEELNKLLDVATSEGADIVIGSRNLDRRCIEKHQSRLRELGGMFFNLMVRWFLGLSLRDTQCGFKLFHREKSRRIFEKQTTPGFGFDPELLFLAKRYGLKIRETPVRWSHAEGSKVKFLRHGIHMFFDLIRIRWNAIAGRYS
ncbi:MAG: glycosyl transferase [Acidobacteria bacterium]|nr:MAG: glycosyl transferase [Acidobacteriota bacterium]